MNNVMFLIVVAIIYVGSTALGLAVFADGASAAYFGLAVGTIGFVAFYKLILNNSKKDD